jgi:hypothetical protein
MSGTSQFPFGWKTRPRDPASLAPDDAVRILDWAMPPVCEPIWWPTETDSWDLAFALTTREIITPTNDFGDAPAPFPTLLPAGARHAVNPAVLLGAAIDAESNGFPHPGALGDDLNNLVDEDGVVLTSLLVPGEQATVQVTASTKGFLSAWVDFSADGSWAEAGDQIFNNVLVTAGVQSLNFSVPFTASRATNTFARFRFSTANIAGFTGQAVDGEVEDYQWHLEELDFGDAQDPSFPTLFVNNGARHLVIQGIFLGASIDSEYDGQPNANATGDNLVNLKDEDGVQLMSPLLPGQNATVQIIASVAGVLNAWIDFGADGSWAQAGDQIASSVFLGAGLNVITFPVPVTAVAGSNVFARFRYTTMAGLPGLSYTGLAPNGEVEDYFWKIDRADFGDAPDRPYPTKLPNGAQHVLGSLFLGAGVDAELDGQPNASATGDDVAFGDDEDGVFFPTALIANVPATIQVVSSGGGYLQGWFDFNRDGDWADASEQAIVNQPLVAGTNFVGFFMPNAVAGKSFARFRLSTVTGLTSTGLAPDGEVEDYEVIFLPLKWTQQPELGSNGVDVNDFVPLADDFQCTQNGPVTDVHIWGSFLSDIVPKGGPGNMNITLTFYRDIPMGSGGFSHPGPPIWTKTFAPGQFSIGPCFATDGEWWHDPATLPPLWKPTADMQIWQLDFYIPADSAFQQVSNVIYWLGVQYTPVGTDSTFSFGWKTSYIQWNDAGCWYDQSVLAWKPLLYGDGHPQAQSITPFNRMNLAFALSTEDLDWGDAPDPAYPTLAVSGGASHRVVSGLMLGNLIDVEGDGQPNATATGDDLSNLGDEDGVTAIPTLIPGQPAAVTVTVTGTGFLNAWIDFGSDGSWAQLDDQILTNLPLSTGTYPVTFMVSSNAAWGQNTFMRFRFSSLKGIPFAGYAPDGEVEDYTIRIWDLPTSDLGDAPDSINGAGVVMTAYPPATRANYPTVYMPGRPILGPMHWNLGYALGFTRSGEIGADWGADQDMINNIIPLTDTANLDGSDDGLTTTPVLPHCGVGKLSVMASLALPGPVFLNVWCDWNRDGDWDDVLACPNGNQAPEWACQNVPVNVTGIVAVPIQAWHPSLQKQPIWIRITLAEMPVPGPLGFSGLPGGAGDGPPAGYQVGETEDYYLTDYEDLQGFDWGDAPSPFPTLQSANGARHLFVPGFCMGRAIDVEADGQPHAMALGDDLNSSNDEDGVQLLTPALAGSNVHVQIFVTSGPVGGKLDAWVDFNGNNSWSDSGEQVFTSLAVATGATTNTFSVPASAKLGTNFARFRLSSAGGLAHTGAAVDGEVEDYFVVLYQPHPTTNIIITNVVVTNLFVTNQVVGLAWTYETNVQYQLRAADALNSTNPAWYNVGPIILGPDHSYWETNAVQTQKFYRVTAPFTWP